MKTVGMIALLTPLMMYPVSATSLDDTIKQHMLNDVLSYIRGSVDRNHVLDEVMRYIDLGSEDKAQIGTFVANYDFDHNGRITHHDYPKIAEDYLHGSLSVAQLNTIKWILNEYDGYIFRASDKLTEHYIYLPYAYAQVEYIKIYINDQFAAELVTKKQLPDGQVILEIANYNPNITIPRDYSILLKIPNNATMTVEGKIRYLDGTPPPYFVVEAWWDFMMGNVKHCDITYSPVGENGSFTMTIQSRFFDWKTLGKYKYVGEEWSDLTSAKFVKRDTYTDLCNKIINNYMTIHSLHSTGWYSALNQMIYMKIWDLRPPRLIINLPVHIKTVCGGG